MKRLIAAVVIAVIAAWLGLVLPTAAFADGATTEATTHVYGATDGGQPTVDTTERGPPLAAAYDHHATNDGVDRSSHGAESRSDATPTRGAYTYNAIAALAPIAGVKATTQGQVQVPVGRLNVCEGGCVAVNAAAQGDHSVLGILDEGSEATAVKVGGRTLMGDEGWRQTLLRAIDDPSTKFTVSLDGFSGSTINSQVMGAVTRGATPVGKLTEWEMTQLYKGGRLGDVTFMRGDSVVPNPWVP